MPRVHKFWSYLLTMLPSDVLTHKLGSVSALSALYETRHERPMRTLSSLGIHALRVERIGTPIRFPSDF